MINFDEIVQMIIARGYNAEIKEITKDGIKRDAIMIAKPGCNISPVIYLDVFNFGDFNGMDAIVDEFIRIAEENSFEEELDLSFLQDWEQVKSKLYLCMGYRCNFGDDVFTKPFLADIVQYMRISVEDSHIKENIVATVVVSSNMANLWKTTHNLSTDDIFKVATENVQNDYHVYDLRTMFMADDTIEALSAEMLILSNENRHYGAGVLTCTKTLNEASDAFGGIDFYLVPSSTHEVLAIRPRDEVNAEGLRTMVQEVNDNELTRKELLSYSVFFYERESETVKQAG